MGATVRSRRRLVTVGRSFLRIFLWPRNPVSRKRRPREAETRFECRLRRRKSEHLVLPRPLGGHVGEAGHSHAMRQPPRDGRFHEIGRQEGKRDRHVDLPNAAPLALGDAFRICARVGKKFVEPAAASRNRCDQERAGLRAYRTSVLRWKPRGQKNLPAPTLTRFSSICIPTGGLPLRIGPDLPRPGRQVENSSPGIEPCSRHTI
jgi:hypothetical protein